tara:strand:+ start:6723 stop:7292 length:570 start_codon:yes stop_codon:yes gene_type:complete
MQHNYRVETHEYNYLVLTTNVLQTLNEESIKKGYNRNLRRGFFDAAAGVKDANEITDRVAIDNYPVTCVMAMPHYHKQGKLTMPHVRAMFNVPTVPVTSIGNPLDFKEVKWEQVLIDIPGETWENIPTVRPYAWIDVPEGSSYERQIYEQAEAKFKDDSKATIEDIEDFLSKSEKEFFSDYAKSNQEEE